MANIRIVSSNEQPSGTFRLLEWLESNLQSDNYQEFYCTVAFAKVKPFYQLHDSIMKWKNSGKKLNAIVGIDHKGTSIQALAYILKNYDNAYVVHTNFSTFHPKMYIFKGKDKAHIYYGSNNFTVGGLETNFEGGTLFDLELPSDYELLEQSLLCYSNLLPSNITCASELTEDLLQTLYDNDKLLDETSAKRQYTSKSVTNSNFKIFNDYHIKPPRSIPKAIMEKASKLTLPDNEMGQTTTSAKLPIVTNGLVIQVNPHHNGEVFLSKRAVTQNPAFFGYPFTGVTTPKPGKPNPGYPQRLPDPVVNIIVYDSIGAPFFTFKEYGLNTVYYEKKGEIRITVTKDFLSHLPIVNADIANYPILVMVNSNDAKCDYDLHFFAPGSELYSYYFSMCTQDMPTGGKKDSKGNPVKPRKMGWI